jgi:hypothetical protein
MVLQIITTIGSFASLMGLIFIILPSGQRLTGLQGFLLGVGMVFFVVTILFMIVMGRKSRIFRVRKEARIRKYMFKWISQDGRAVIFSRNLSWVRDEQMKDLLRRKAERNELTVCLPNRIQLLEDLEQAGAEICIYPELGYVPAASFTIVRQGRMDSRVAVGRMIKNKHVIEEFGVGEHPVFHVANDLTSIIIRFSHSRGNNEADGR